MLYISRPDNKRKRGWGYELVLISCDYFCGKILHYNKKGSVSSKHFHKIKREFFKTLKGSFELHHFDNNGNNVVSILKGGDCVYIDQCEPHQLKALEPHSEILEISTKDDKWDIVRISPGESQSKKFKEIEDGDEII